MKRGEVWWANLPPPAGRRPVLLLSRDSAYRVRWFVTVAPLTTRMRHIPAEVPLGPEDGLPRECVANLDTITTIPKGSLEGLVTALSLSKMEAVDGAIHFALGLVE